MARLAPMISGCAHSAHSSQSNRLRAVRRSDSRMIIDAGRRWSVTKVWKKTPPQPQQNQPEEYGPPLDQHLYRKATERAVLAPPK